MPSATSVTIVMGNEACDQDSGVSALSYAFHLSLINGGVGGIFVPMLNIDSEDFPLKTELLASLEEKGIRQQDLVFRDVLDMESLGDKLRVILVDHNALADKDLWMNDKIVEVIDHHAQEREGENVIIEPVGSCSTLIAEKIFKENPDFIDTITLDLIYKTILLDTVCLDENAKRVTPKDVKIIKLIEGKIGKQDRQDIFDKIWREKQRTDHLTPLQLLRRDLKRVKNKKGNISIAISSVPMLVEKYIALPNVEEDLKKFADNKHIIIIMGISVDECGVTRDLFIADDDNQNEVIQRISNFLEESQQPNLGLTKKRHALGQYFGQKNSAASRKQILPLVKQTIIDL